MVAAGGIEVYLLYQRKVILMLTGDPGGAVYSRYDALFGLSP